MIKMIIKSLEMKNYRPYRQPPKINFAYGDKNLTIIEGDNDLGKTTFLRDLIRNLSDKYRKNVGVVDFVGWIFFCKFVGCV